MGAGGRRRVQQGEPREVDVQTTVQVEGLTLLVDVKGLSDPSPPIASFLLPD